MDYEKAAKYEELNSNKLIKDWLSEFKEQSTTRKYLHRMVKFFESMNLNPDSLASMDVSEIKKVILEYQAKCKANGQKNNGILSIIVAVRSFSAYLNKPLKFRKSQLLKLEADTDSHIFSNGDFKLLFDVGDTFEKAIIATAVSQGWEISSFLEQDRLTVQRRLEHAKQNNENFIFFEQTRQKTGVLRFCVLNPLAIEWLTKYLALRNDNDPRLFPITIDGLQKLMHRLAVDSGLKATGNIRFHKIRAWLMSRLSRAGFNEFQIKFIIGHAIPLTDRAYLNSLKEEITEKYPVVYDDYFNIVPELHGQSQKLKQLEQKIAVMEVLEQKVASMAVMEQKVTSMEQKVASMESLYDKIFETNSEKMTLLLQLMQEVTPEKLALLLQELNNKGFAQQKEEDIKQYNTEV